MKKSKILKNKPLLCKIEFKMYQRNFWSIFHVVKYCIPITIKIAIMHQIVKLSSNEQRTGVACIHWHFQSINFYYTTIIKSRASIDGTPNRIQIRARSSQKVSLIMIIGGSNLMRIGLIDQAKQVRPLFVNCTVKRCYIIIRDAPIASPADYQLIIDYIIDF